MNACQPPYVYTLSEASQLLDPLRALVRDMQAAQRDAIVAGNELEQLTPAMRGNGHATRAEELQTSLARSLATLHEGQVELERLGVELKDLSMGLLDFPSLRGGQIVYLCWLVHEPRIAYWHERNAGFAGRKPLTDFEVKQGADGTL
jgi:hypothetical protein